MKTVLREALIRGKLSVYKGDMGIKKEEYQPLDVPNYTTTEKSTPRLVFCTLLIVQVLLLILWVLTLIVKSKNGQISNLDERRYLQSNTYPVFVESNIFKENYKENYQSSFRGLVLGENIICTNISNDEKFDCFPEEGANKQSCWSRFCCWEENDFYGVPSCYYPRNYNGYKLLNTSRKAHGVQYFMTRTYPSPYNQDVKVVKIDVRYITDKILQIKMLDPLGRRYEPPLPEIPKSTKPPGSKLRYRVNFTDGGLKIDRQDGTPLTSFERHGGFIFADQFLQVSLKFDGKVYGLGEHQTSLQLDTNWTKYTLFAGDGIPEPGENLYGSHPFYMVLDSNGSSHGVFFHNSNAMDVILQPSPAITFRSIGGIFNFFIFVGPTPAEVIKQFTEIVGRPFLPPYWSMGFHLSRLGYKNTAHIRDVWNRTRAAKIPFDTQWHDIDYMDRKNDFTYDKRHYPDLPAFVDEIHQAGMYYVPIIDPGISGCEAKDTYPPFTEGEKLKVFLKYMNGSMFIGKVWNDKCTVFPDFSSDQTIRWWGNQIKKFQNVIPFDGIWLDMNEPSNFLNGSFDGCTENLLESPPYLPNVKGGKLYSLTICMSTVHSAGFHYNYHNLYGFSEAVATFRALKMMNKRPFIISRSTYPGSGKYAGHWSGDVTSTWEAMRGTIPKMLSFSLFGISMMGADICGFNGNTTAALCQRWSQLGAFYPFSRNHNSDDCIDQDPVALGEDVVISAKKALMVRYTLLPYLYTLFYMAHAAGETVARPLFVEFWYDKETHDIDDTFLWGCCLLIAPVLEPNVTTLKLYLPEGRWYDWYTGLGFDSPGTHMVVNASSDTIPLFIRGGVIIPTHAPAVTTALSRENNIDLIAAFNSSLDATGMMYWDEGATVSPICRKKYGKLLFDLNFKRLKGSKKHWTAVRPLTLGYIKILGFWKPVTRVLFNGETKDFTWNSTSLILTVKVNHLLPVPFVMEWH